MGVKYDAGGLSSEKERQTFPAAKNLRRSERILIRLSISVSGKVGNTQKFFKEGRTLVVSRYGATITVDWDLRAGQNIIIQCVNGNEQAEAQVVEKIKDQPKATFTASSSWNPLSLSGASRFPRLLNHRWRSYGCCSGVLHAGKSKWRT